MKSNERLIGKKELLQLLPYSIQHLYRLEKQGKFVQRIRLTANRVAWREADVLAWIAQKIAAQNTTSTKS